MTSVVAALGTPFPGNTTHHFFYLVRWRLAEHWTHSFIPRNICVLPAIHVPSIQMQKDRPMITTPWEELLLPPTRLLAAAHRHSQQQHGQVQSRHFISDPYAMRHSPVSSEK